MADRISNFEKTVYLINNFLGAMPRAVYDNLKMYADT